MNKIIAFFLIFLPIETTFAGQRLSELKPGSLCDKIPQIEKQLDSIALGTHDASGIIKYKGKQGGEEATIVYLCEQGRLTKQEIIFTTTTQSKAYLIANEQRNTLIKDLGDPIHDGLNLGGFRKIMFGVLGADLDFLTSVIVWGRAKEDVMLLIKEAKNKLWTITISQGSSKMEYILNS